MRIEKRRKGANFAEGDMTPMIDMTFQLIAFFMVLVNFSEAEQDQRVTLPQSVLAKPPEDMVKPVTLHLTADSTVIYAGREYTIEGVQAALSAKARLVEDQGSSREKVTVIIRADEKAKTGAVQELIKVCQQEKFEKFALRARQKKIHGNTGG